MSRRAAEKELSIFFVLDFGQIQAKFTFCRELLIYSFLRKKTKTGLSSNPFVLERLGCIPPVSVHAIT
jgi:hypothetical protein